MSFRSTKPGKPTAACICRCPVIDGIDLASLVEREGPMSPQLAVKVIEQLASALDVAHTAGLVHRDVKPSNALITQNEFAYLLDFGIAHDATATKITPTGTVMGTLAYMAPERFETGIADASADVYPLAGVLHECLTGEQPFPGTSLPQQMHAHLYQAPPKPSNQRPDIPTGFDAVVARGMAKDPAKRYRTASELAAAAREALTRAAPQPAPQLPRAHAAPADRWCIRTARSPSSRPGDPDRPRCVVGGRHSPG